MTEETIPMKAIVVTDEAAGTAGMALLERPEPPAAINDVVVQVHASGFVPTEMAWPSTWTDRGEAGRRRLHGGREPADLGPDSVAGVVRPRPPSGGADRPRARRGRRSRDD